MPPTLAPQWMRLHMLGADTVANAKATAKSASVRPAAQDFDKSWFKQARRSRCLPPPPWLPLRERVCTLPSVSPMPGSPAFSLPPCLCTRLTLLRPPIPFPSLPLPREQWLTPRFKTLPVHSPSPLRVRLPACKRPRQVRLVPRTRAFRLVSARCRPVVCLWTSFAEPLRLSPLQPLHWDSSDWSHLIYCMALVSTS